MKNKKLLKYFTEQILPILDEIEFNDTEHEENHEVVSFSAYGQYGDKYKLIYKEREPID